MLMVWEVFLISNLLAGIEAFLTCVILFIGFRISEYYFPRNRKKQAYSFLAAIPFYAAYKAFFIISTIEIGSFSMFSFLGSLMLFIAGILVFLGVGYLIKNLGKKECDLAK